MRCPSCNSLDTQVKDSRPTEDSAVIRRRRVCVACNFRFTTFERVQLRELTVIKRNGRRVPFDRDKLVRSLQISLRKRPVDPERVEKMVSAIVRELESGGEAEISSEAIGEIVMEHLRQLDDVAYVRFASVYRNFREAKDFEAVLGELSGDDDSAARHVTQMIFRILEDQFAQKSRVSKAADQRFMELALALGRRGQGRTWPNPAVGAVVVKDGVIVGRGWTQPGGRPHAEPEALRRAGEAARGATLYVTLEPCSHVGKSPPCADAVIAAGIARVVSAIEDPNPEVAGQGHARLRAAGIAVDIGPRRRRGRARSRRAFPAHPRQAPACDPQARGVVRRQDRRRRPQAGRDHRRGREGAGASAARAMRRHPGRDRHRAGGRSAADLPPAGHGGALAGAGGAGPRACAFPAPAGWCIRRARRRCG